MSDMIQHALFHHPLQANWSQHQMLFLGMGCFWGAEKQFWSLPGVISTSVGYAGGRTVQPTYEEVCSGRTGHAEVVQVVYDEGALPLRSLLSLFWDRHNPTQGHRQGNDVGEQYRSVIFVNNALHLTSAIASKNHYDEQLRNSGFPPITTEIEMLQSYYLAEDYHQQYLIKNPHGYCALKGTGIACTI